MKQLRRKEPVYVPMIREPILSKILFKEKVHHYARGVGKNNLAQQIIWHPRLTRECFSHESSNEVELKCTKIQIEQDTHKIEFKSSKLPR